MNRLTIVTIITCLIAVQAFTQNAPETPPAVQSTFMVVKLTDHAKKVSFKSLNKDEFKALSKEISDEESHWDKALEIAEKTWAKDLDTAKKTFPKGAISERKATIVEAFTSEDKAAAKLNEMEKKLADLEAAEKKHDEEKAKGLTTPKGRRGGIVFKPNSKAVENKKMANEQLTALEEKAISLFESAMVEITGKQLSTEASAPPEPAVKAKPDTKKKAAKK